ncbi:MAG TPA: DUF6152 family protein [Micropepsaceae bacterium]|nr:DUF6152 family protein [Micropepsaceae bacterium]
MLKPVISVITIFAALAAYPAMAHHSDAMFASDKELVLNGTVKQFQYTNPHSWIQLVVPAAAGAPVEWSIETGAPIVLLRAGIKPTALQPGDKVSLRVHPLKDGGAGGSLIEVTKEDGSTLSLKGPRAY